MKHITALVMALATLGFASTALAASSSGHMMKKSMMPQCKGATVYAVASTKTYYTKGTTMYGHAKGGAYMCQAAANAKGYHAAKP